MKINRENFYFFHLANNYFNFIILRIYLCDSIVIFAETSKEKLIGDICKNKMRCPYSKLLDELESY